MGDADADPEANGTTQETSSTNREYGEAGSGDSAPDPVTNARDSRRLDSATEPREPAMEDGGFNNPSGAFQGRLLAGIA